jgi:hypothetical protein
LAHCTRYRNRAQYPAQPPPPPSARCASGEGATGPAGPRSVSPGGGAAAAAAKRAMQQSAKSGGVGAVRRGRGRCPFRGGGSRYPRALITAPGAVVRQRGAQRSCGAATQRPRRMEAARWQHGHGWDGGGWCILCFTPQIDRRRIFRSNKWGALRAGLGRFRTGERGELQSCGSVWWWASIGCGACSVLVHPWRTNRCIPLRRTSSN